MVNRTRPLVNESGFYSLVMGSEVPGAKQFQRWVTHEVLPALRKTGDGFPMSASSPADPVNQFACRRTSLGERVNRAEMITS
jgi:anti-repressor protein